MKGSRAVPRGVNKLLADIVCARWHRAQFQLFRFIFFRPPHTTLPFSRAGDSPTRFFFAPQIARVVYVPGPPAPRRAIQPLFCLAVVAPVCPVSSRLAQSSRMVIKSAPLRPAGETVHNNNAPRYTYVRTWRGTRHSSRLHYESCNVQFRAFFIRLTDKLSIVYSRSEEDLLLPPANRPSRLYFQLSSVANSAA